MPLTTPQLEAIDRLKNKYNGGDYDPSTNPGGMGNDGHRPNFIPSLQDGALAVEGAAEQAEAAAGYAAAARGAGIFFVFDTATADADPGAGKFRLNNAALASATALFIDLSTAAGADVTAWIATWDDSDSTVRGELTFIHATDATIWAKFQIIGANTNPAGYRKVAIAYVAHAGALANGAEFAIAFSRTGGKGIPGDEGDAGPAPTLTIGTVSTGAPGTDVDFDLVPTGPGAYQVNVSIPRGNPGEDGEGAGNVNPTGAITSGRLARFADGTGNLIEDSGKTIADFATAAQGALADSAVQPGDLAAVAMTGAYSDLTGKPTLGTAAALNVGNGANNVPQLDGAGKLLASILPAIAISTVSTVASQAAMLALAAEQGDVAIRTDVSKTFILATNSPSTLADWKELPVPTDLVQSVAGLTGTITASALRAALNVADGADVTATAINAAAAKNTLVDADGIIVSDSAAGGAPKKHTWAFLKSGIWSALGPLIAAGTAKTTLDANDNFAIGDSATSNASRRITWANVMVAFRDAMGSLFNSATAKATPVDADLVAIGDSAAIWATKKSTIAQIGSTIVSAARVMASLNGTNTRLGTIAQSVADWNNAAENGWYMGSDAANAPASGWFIGQAWFHGAGGWCVQTLVAFTSTTDADSQMWRRVQINGVWQAWHRLRTTQTELDARYLSGGGLTLISAQTATNVAAIAFTGIDGTYDEYELHLQGVVPATSGANFNLLTSSNGGSSYDASNGAYKSFNSGGASNSASPIIANSDSAVSLALCGNVGNGAADAGIGGVIKLLRPSDAARYKSVLWDITLNASSGPLVTHRGGGQRVSTAAVNAVQFSFSSGNISAGFFKLYGVRKS